MSLWAQERRLPACPACVRVPRVCALCHVCPRLASRHRPGSRDYRRADGARRRASEEQLQRRGRLVTLIKWDDHRVTLRRYLMGSFPSPAPSARGFVRLVSTARGRHGLPAENPKQVGPSSCPPGTPTVHGGRVSVCPRPPGADRAGAWPSASS
jgi:hypothetical protein